MENENPSESNPDVSERALSGYSSELSPSDRQEDAQVTKPSVPEPQQGQPESIFYREGPIPDPVSLQEYGSVVPGFARDFLGSFLEESRHRREIESRELKLEEDALLLEGKLVDGNQRRSYWGLFTGFVVCMSALLIGGGLVYTGHDVSGTVIAGSTLPALVAVFVTGSWNRRKQKENEDEVAKAEDE